MKKRTIKTPVAANRSHEQLRALYLSNAKDLARGTYDGFTSSEISAYNGRLMFGANDEAFPGEKAWSRITD